MGNEDIDSGPGPSELASTGRQTPEATDRAHQTRILNDELRKHHRGGMVVMTAGLAALGAEKVHQVVTAIAVFDDFNAENDPYGEHDCGVLDVDGQEVMFKIEYYDLDQVYASPDPANPAVTQRVITLMLASDY